MLKVPARTPVTTGVGGLRLPAGLIVEVSTFGWPEI
jgi:hypothetical protein